MGVFASGEFIILAARNRTIATDSFGPTAEACSPIFTAAKLPLVNGGNWHTAEVYAPIFIATNQPLAIVFWKSMNHKLRLCLSDQIALSAN
jgi:hypothetical protein